MALKERINPFDKTVRNELSEKTIKLTNKYLYPFVTDRFAAEDVVFLNYGYEEDPPLGLALQAEDEANRHCINLYHRTAAQVDLEGERVLEVGCGHGGGASYVKRYLRPASYVGLDLNPTGIEFCRTRHRLDGLEFTQGDAEALPFPDESFDAVLNVESSHCYPHFSRFLTEVARVLRPGGHFLYTDCRVTRSVGEWEDDLANAPLRMLSCADIEPQIARGMKAGRPGTEAVLSRTMPAYLRGLARMQADWGRRTLTKGNLAYRVYCFQKD